MKIPSLSKFGEISNKPTPESMREVQDYGAVELYGMKQDIDERKKYSLKTFRLICGWLIGVFVLLFLNSLKTSLFTFEISETILLAIIGGTTVNVLGVFIFVMKYLFELKRGAVK